MANRRKVRIYFGSHKDCFVHGTREWASWIKTTQDNLSIISLTLSDDFKVFATFSNRPALPSNRNKKAKNLQPSEYLEIDPDYAKCLGIKEGDPAVVECIPDVTVCQSMTVESNDQNDYEVLAENKERVVFQMLDQVRIISCKRPFAVWINQQPIFLKLVKSEPPASWVLICNKTYLDIHTPADYANSMLSPSLPTSPLPGRTDSQDSDESGQTGSTSSSYFSSLSHQTKNSRVHTSEPSRGTPGGTRDLYSYSSKRFSQSDTGSLGDALCFSKDNEFPNASSSSSNITDDGGMVTSVLNFLNRSLFHGNSPSEEQNPLTHHPHSKQQAKIPFLSPREEFKSPIKKKAAMSKSYTYGTKGKHSKTPSWHGRTEFEIEKEQYYIKSINTPFTLNPIHVRVQELNLEKVKAVWDIHDYNEVFVHPATLPDLFQASGGGRESYLVSLSFISGTKSGVSVAGSTKDSKGGASSSNGHSNTPTPVQPKQSSHLPEKPKKDDLGLVHMITQLTNYEASTPAITLTPPTNQPPANLTRPQSALTSSVVCHLRFATTIRFNNKRRKSASQTLEEVSISREGSTSPTTSGHPSPNRQPRVLGCVSVLPHHIVMSGLIRQQLGVMAGSVIRLTSCHDNWKVNCRHNRVILYLHPIAQKAYDASGSVNDGRKKSDIIRAFKNWVSKFEDNPYKCVFANNMVIPLNTNLNRSGSSLVSCTSEDVLLCKVTCKIERPSSTLLPNDPPHKIFAITVNDFKKDSKEVMNGIEITPVIDKQDEQGPNAKQGNDFPSLDELSPIKLQESIEQFGGMDELFSTSYQLLINLLEHTHGGVMLICGIGRGGGVGGCGKTSLSRLLCKQLMESHHKAHVISVSCTLLRGKRYESIQKRFNGILNEVIQCQPAVILLDDLDHCAQNITDVQREATGEGIMHLRTAQVFLDFVDILRQRMVKAVVIVTATNKDLLHPSLLHSKGKHIFSETVEIPLPTLTTRQNILQAILRNAKVASVLSEHDLRKICLKTEGYQAIDLKVLVDRAISNAEQRALLSQIDKQRTEYQQQGGSGILGVSVMSVGLNDFLSALDSYVPASLSGLSLHKNSNISFSNVGGLADAKTTLQETLLWPSKYPGLFKSCPIKQHAGVLLYGAPGTGKTLLAGAVANEFGLNFVSIKGPELLNKFIGASEQSVRDLFTRAQSARPCILFFDEFDSLAPRRGHDRTGVTDRVVNQILTQLDGVEALEGVYVLAASSRPDLIDPALLRPGRIDKILLCNMPTEIEREQILKALSKGLPLSLDVDFKQIASMTPEYTGADLKALLYNAQLLQVRRTLETEDTSKLTSSDTGPTDDNTTTDNSTENVWQFKFNKQTAGIERRMVKQLLEIDNSNSRSKKKGQTKCLLSQEDLLVSLKSTKPSLSETEKEKYEKIYKKFLGKSKTKVTTADLDPRATLA